MTTKKNSKDKMIGSMCSDIEVFDIFPGYPNQDVSSKLKPNIPNQFEDEGGTTVHVFIVPPRHTLIINPEDITQEVLLEPYDSKHKFINGVISVYAESPLAGTSKRIYSGASAFHNPESEISNIEIRRRWQAKAELKPGDKLRTKFLATEAIDPEQTHLDHRVNISIEDMSKIKIRKRDTELYMIYPTSPNEECSSKISINKPNEASYIYTFKPPTGHIVCIYPEDERCGVEFEARNKAGTLILGEVEIFLRRSVRGFQQRIYMGVSGEPNAKNKMWFHPDRIFPGDCMEVRFNSKQKLDPHTTKLNLRVRVFKTTP